MDDTNFTKYGYHQTDRADKTTLCLDNPVRAEKWYDTLDKFVFWSCQDVHVRCIQHRGNGLRPQIRAGNTTFKRPPPPPSYKNNSSRIDLPFERLTRNSWDPGNPGNPRNSGNLWNLRNPEYLLNLNVFQDRPTNIPSCMHTHLTQHVAQLRPSRPDRIVHSSSEEMQESYQKPVRKSNHTRTGHYADTPKSNNSIAILHKDTDNGNDVNDVDDQCYSSYNQLWFHENDQVHGHLKPSDHTSLLSRSLLWQHGNRNHLTHTPARGVLPPITRVANHARLS